MIDMEPTITIEPLLEIAITMALPCGETKCPQFAERTLAIRSHGAELLMPICRKHAKLFSDIELTDE